MENNQNRDYKVLTAFPQYIATAITDQIKQADTKALGMLGVLGVLISALLAKLNTLKSALTTSNPLWLFIFGFSAIMVLLSLKFILAVVYPRSSKTKSASLIYFKDIASANRTAYLERGESLSEAEIVRENYANAHALAGVANRKYQALKRAMICTIITLVWVVGLLLLW